jgi:hypothetical protein
LALALGDPDVLWSEREALALHNAHFSDYVDLYQRSVELRNTAKLASVLARRVTVVPLITDHAVLANVTAFGFGVIVSAIITAIATSRREFQSWLRTEQVKASRKFHRSALALQAYVVTGAPREAIGNLDHVGLAHAANGVYPLLVELANKYQDLTEIAGSGTHRAATKVLDILPRLAWQAVPLPGVINAASIKQREDATIAMAQLTVLFTFAMRKDTRATPWIKRWKESFDVWASRKRSIYRRQATSPTDRKDCPPAGEILRDWQVRPLYSDEIPTTDDGYRVYSPISLATEVGAFVPYALCVKPAFAPWRFGIVAGLPQNVEYEMVADAVRVIAGNFHGYRRMYQPALHQDPNGLRTVAWL